MSPPGVSSPAGGESCASPALCFQCACPCLHAPRRRHAPLAACLPPGCCLLLLEQPLQPLHPGAGPSSPRGGAWPHGRGSIAEAAANALMKGSPRGVTPTHSAAALGAAADKAAASGVAAVQAKLQKLTVSCF